jgi:hypothetical protein
MFDPASCILLASNLINMPATEACGEQDQVTGHMRHMSAWVQDVEIQGSRKSTLWI